MRRKGFTLIELVMVIVIIGILAAVAIPKFISLRNEAKRAVCQSNVGAIRTALSNFYAKCQINQTCPDGVGCVVADCFPNATELNYDVNATAFGANYFSEKSLPNNSSITNGTGNWGARYNSTTGIVDLQACCG